MVIEAHQTLVLLSGLIVLAFFYEHLARLSRVPVVIFLLATGMLLRLAAEIFHAPIPDLAMWLPMLGMVGLVLIVFEAALDLEIERSRLPRIGKSALCAAAILAATGALIAWVFHFWTGAPYRLAWINAVPLAVISSAIAIPSAQGLDPERREFIVYESTFSDIFGILLFNFLSAGTGMTWHASLGRMVLEIGIVVLFSAASIVFIGWMLARNRSGNKLALLLAILVLVFAGGKWAHLPTLLLVFGLGISLNNARLAGPWLQKIGVRLRDLRWEMRFLKRLTSEITFLVRTYFFILFGLSVSRSAFTGLPAVAFSLIICAAILGVRAGALWGVFRSSVFPEVFIAPRGLITILLFYSIPRRDLLPQVSHDVVLIVVLASILGMAAALFFQRKRAAPVEASHAVEAG